jgi:hypothetical protein
MTSKVAAGCCRSLLLLPKKGSVETAIAALVLPQVLSFLANPSDVEGLEESRSTLALTVVQLISSLSTPEQRVLAGKIIVPALLARASKEPISVGETAARLLELAGKDQEVFRAVVGGLSVDQRGFIERVLKEGVGKRRERVERDEGEEPSIKLTMDFGS